MTIIVLVHLNLKKRITGQTGVIGTRNVEIMVLLKYLRNFWRTIEMPLINCEKCFELTCYANYVISSDVAANQAATYEITDINPR